MIKSVESIIVSVVKCLLFFIPKLISSTPNFEVMNNIFVVVIVNNNGANLFFNESVINHGEKREKI